ncbi:hypothetical protein D3C86_2129990 [compost metagenome]
MASEFNEIDNSSQNYIADKKPFLLHFVLVAVVEIVVHHRGAETEDHQYKTEHPAILAVMLVHMQRRRAQHEVHQPHAETGTVQINA